jgi:hypothetical protein
MMLVLYGHSAAVARGDGIPPIFVALPRGKPS